ncbi:MAG: hypothetical protein A2104_05485 [Candidatus Melainabacteria bacterium GWF2_32_7]|nr:MAG: hypothetical protein A2104_05485 [Candidatus Melainabacteria bacterium GWF2_32_7]
MSHIHIQDGILSIWLIIIGYLLIGLYLIFLFFNKKKFIANKKIALVGVISALMLITMTVEIIPPAYHMNMAVLSGIILGPVLSILAIFVANIILAFLGHGGISVIALNTIVVSIEAILGFWGFKLLSSKIKNIFISVFLAAFLALFASAWISAGVVYLGTSGVESPFHNHEHAIETVHEHSSVEHHNVNSVSNHNAIDFNLGRFLFAILSLGIFGWVIEAVITAFMLKYIKQVKPDIIEYDISPGIE